MQHKVPDTKADASHRLAVANPWFLLPVGGPPERQSVAEFLAGDNARSLGGGDVPGGRPTLGLNGEARDRALRVA